MTYKQKLIDLLKSDGEVKTAMEKLEFGCNVRHHYDTNGGTSYSDLKFISETEEVIIYVYKCKNADIQNNIIIFEKNKIEAEEAFEIIGLPLQERFITMYLDKKIGEFNHYNVDYKGIFLHINDESIFIEIDKNKDYDNQSEETYEKIYLALTNLINE